MLSCNPVEDVIEGNFSAQRIAVLAGLEEDLMEGSEVMSHSYGSPTESRASVGRMG